MSNKHRSKQAIFLTLLFIACTVNAQYSYNGDFRGGDANVTQADTLSDMMVFDNVDVQGSHITTIWGNFLIYQQYTSSSLGLKYQIRTGVSSGNAGTLVASGSVSNLQQTLTGRSTQNDAYREVQLLGNVSIDLAPGVYWLGLQNNEGSNPTASWTSFLSQTSGADNGSASDPNPAPKNAILDHSSFATGTELGDYIQQGADYSMGVSTTPEPSPALLVSIATVILVAKRRRSTA